MAAIKATSGSDAIVAAGIVRLASAERASVVITMVNRIERVEIDTYD